MSITHTLRFEPPSLVNSHEIQVFRYRCRLHYTPPRAETAEPCGIYRQSGGLPVVSCPSRLSKTPSLHSQNLKTGDIRSINRSVRASGLAVWVLAVHGIASKVGHIVEVLDADFVAHPCPQRDLNKTGISPFIPVPKVGHHHHAEGRYWMSTVDYFDCLHANGNTGVDLVEVVTVYSLDRVPACH